MGLVFSRPRSPRQRMGLPNMPRPRIPMRMNRINQPPKGAHEFPAGRQGFIPHTPKNSVMTHNSQNQMFAPIAASSGVN
jgi:hypothetical protein